MHGLIATFFCKFLDVSTDVGKFRLIDWLTLLQLAPLTKDPRISYRVSTHHHTMSTRFVNQIGCLNRPGYIAVGNDGTLHFFDRLGNRRVIYFRPVKSFHRATMHSE